MSRFSTPLVLLALALFATEASAQARLTGGTPSSSEKPTESRGAIVGDGGFETGTPNAAWTDFSSNFGTVLCDAGCGTGGGTGPHAGAWWVWFGGTASAESGFVQQDVTIPSAASAELTFWLEIPSTANTGTMNVMMDGTILESYTEADGPAFATYQEVTLDVSAYADGGVHTLRFEQSNPAGAGVINFFVDDVAIEAAVAGASLSVNPIAIDFGSVSTGSTASRTVTLTSNGSDPVAIASIVASGDAAFSVDLTGTDLALDPGESTTFAVDFAPTDVGGVTGSVTITSNAAGSPATITLDGAGAVFSVYNSTDTPLPIPDNNPGGVVSTLTVAAGAPTIADLDLDLDVSHTWIGDVIATLAHDGTSVTAFDRPGVPFFGTVGCRENNANIILDDEGDLGPVEDGCPNVDTNAEAFVIDGRYTPNNPLSAFDGMSAVGTWTLTVSDNAGLDTGTLNAWAIIVTPEGVATEGTPGAVSRLSVAPNPVVGQGQFELVVATAQDVRVVLYDALGREVRVLLDRPMAAAQQAVVGFSTAGLTPGAYFVRATGADFEAMQRVTVVR